jgi:hypothetical protein
MSLRAIPVTIIAFLLYNIIVLFSGFGGGETAADGTAVAVTDGAAAARDLLAAKIFALPMLREATWIFTWGDLILVIMMVLLFIEILKATYTSTSSLVDHGLSMLIFIAALIEFMVVPQAATSVFFIILIGLLIDVIAGFTIGIRVAKRDIGFGSGDN